MRLMTTPRMSSPLSATVSSPLVHIGADDTVNDVLGRYPATASIFHLLGLDTCCRAHLTLGDAAVHARTDLAVLLSMLEASACASFAGSGRR
jgi:iron-sulfur cluster repair protein YtfE (RIC family)